MCCGRCSCGKDSTKENVDRPTIYPLLGDIADESPMLDGDHND